MFKVAIYFMCMFVMFFVKIFEYIFNFIVNVIVFLLNKDKKDKDVIYYVDSGNKEKKNNVKEKKVTTKKKEEMSDFDKEADLWGLSEEDRRIAKQERMSPADYVEAEEYDDDELLKDDWDR